MEIEDQECTFPLDQLPELIIEKIAWYLRNKDLAACCAVSRGVREAFDIECVWRPRYDADRAEYLMKTPCKVHPIFESPDNTNNGLSPISQYRLAFMAENHLWNNWRQGTSTIQHVDMIDVDSMYGYEVISNTFVSDYYIASLFPESIKITDVRSSHAFKPIPTPWYSNVRVAKDKIIVLFHSSVQVFHLDASTNQWVLKHSFYIDEAEILVDNRLLATAESFYENRPDYTYTLLDHFIVGAADIGGTMHVWNYETGVKIKTELCSVENAVIHEIRTTTSKDLILSVQQGGNCDSLLLVYSLPQLKFLPFRQLVCTSNSFNYIIISNFISVWYDNKLNIYDYQNCQIKLEDHPIDHYSKVVPLDNNIVFLEGNYLKLFNPWTSKMRSFEDKVTDFLVLCNRFVIIERCLEERTVDLLEFSDNCNTFSKKVNLMFNLAYDDIDDIDESCCFYEFYLEENKHSTSVIRESSVWHFW